MHEVVARSQEGRYVAVVGLAGSGKWALAASLAAGPEVTEGTVPSDFVQAVAFLTSGTLAPEVASTLSDQLARSLPGFAATRDRFQQALTEDEKRQLDSLQRDVLGPLRWLGGGEAIRVVVDGLDQLRNGEQRAVHVALDALVTDPGLSRVRMVVTSRPDTPVQRVRPRYGSTSHPTRTSAPTWPAVRSRSRCMGQSRSGQAATG